MSSLSYTPDSKTLRKYDVEEKQVFEKELRDFSLWQMLHQRLQMGPAETFVHIEVEKIAKLRRGKTIEYKFGKTHSAGAIFRRRGMILTVFHFKQFKKIHIITLRPEHPDWRNYQRTLALRRLAKLEKKIRRRSKRLFNFIDEAKKKRREWTDTESLFHRKKMEISEKYNVTKREFMNLMRTYFELLRKAEPKNFKR